MNPIALRNELTFVVPKDECTVVYLNDPQFGKIPIFTRPITPMDLTANSVVVIVGRMLTPASRETFHKAFGLPVPVSVLEGDLARQCLDMTMEQRAVYADVVARYNTAAFPEEIRLRYLLYTEEMNEIASLSFFRWCSVMSEASMSITSTVANAAWVATHAKEQDTRECAARVCTRLCDMMKRYNRYKDIGKFFMLLWITYMLFGLIKMFLLSL